MEFLLALSLFGSMFWAIALISIFIFITFVAEVEENGFLSTAFLIALGFTFYMWGNESFKEITSVISIMSIVYYLAIGFGFALFRTFMHGRKEQQRRNRDISEKRSYVHKVNMNLSGHFARWWFQWPVSLLSWFFRDMFKEIYVWAYSRIDKIVSAIFKYGMKSVGMLEELPKEEEK